MHSSNNCTYIQPRECTRHNRERVWLRETSTEKQLGTKLPVFYKLRLLLNGKCGTSRDRRKKKNWSFVSTTMLDREKSVISPPTQRGARNIVGADM